MAISKNEIYTRIVNAVKAEFPSIYYAGQLEPIPSSFPAMFIRMIGKAVYANLETLAFDSQIFNGTWEIQVYSNKENDAGTEAYQIMDLVSATMQRLGFLCDMVQPMDNIDPAVFRIIGRWHRLIGYEGESLSADESAKT